MSGLMASLNVSSWMSEPQLAVISPQAARFNASSTRQGETGSPANQSAR